ncbi:MAG: (Fe-S)-binding protein, partial [Promethearchaeia archaeon]
MTESKGNINHLKEVEAAAMSCVQCGQCRAAIWPLNNIYYVCPVYNTEYTSKFEPFSPRGKNVILKGLFWGDLELSYELSEFIFQCTLCGACEKFCHNSFNENIVFANNRWMEQVKVFEALRADLVEAGFGLEAHIPMNKALVELLNPYERDNNEKENWIKKLNFPIKKLGEENAETLYFVGCTAALTPQLHNIALSTATVLKEFNEDFAILGGKEICCGSVAMRTGDRKAFEHVAELNTKLFKESGIKRIITSCAGCYRTLKQDYGNRLEGIEILHIVEFLEKKLDDGEIKLKNTQIKITYHDPCHLGRHMGLYDAPRKILQKIAILNEMKSIKEGALCCGAGGGVKKGFPELALEMAKNRIKQAEETNAEVLVSTCPFCYRNLNDAVNSLNSELKVLDLIELFLNSMK